MEKVVSRELLEEGFKCCREFMGGSWTLATRDQFTVTRVLGGLSNTLYKCSLKDDYPVSKKEQRHVLMRIYGEIIFDDHETVLNDSITFALLSERSLGPKLYAVLPWGRLEEYIPSRALYTPELHKPVISKACARIMCRFHQLNMPMNKQPRWLFDTIQRYLEEALTYIDQIHYIPPVDLREEFKQLKAITSKIKSPVVFCHNDLQEGNILYIGENLVENGTYSDGDKNDEKNYEINDKINGGMNGRSNGGTDRNDDDGHHCDHTNDILRPIDFEYASYNYRGFDIGNHFCEWCYNYHHSTPPFFKADLTAYPDKEQQLLFVREYISEKKRIRMKSNRKGVIRVNEDEGDDEDSLLLEANGFALASHFLASMWSLVQAHKSNITFGYMEYSEARLQAYLCQKPKVIQMLRQYKRNKTTSIRV